jgi:hypothetical protein
MTDIDAIALTRAFIRADMLPIDGVCLDDIDPHNTDPHLATVLVNMAYYGFAPTLDALKFLAALSHEDLATYWADVETVLANLTGADRAMQDHIVYKNFPAETLAMCDAEYWTRQLLIYIGMPQDALAQTKQNREAPDETLSLRLLKPSADFTTTDLFNRLVSASSTWTEDQYEDACVLFKILEMTSLDFSDFPTKSNAARLAGYALARNADLDLSFTAPIDILRLVAALSGADVRLNTPMRGVSLKRRLRTRIIKSLDDFTSATLIEAFAQRRNLWKLVLMRLHPGDYKTENLSVAYDLLYRGQARSFEAALSMAIDAGNPLALEMAAKRPGIFARRLRHMHSKFGRAAFEAFAPVAPQLSTLQLARLDRIFKTLLSRKARTYAPKGRMSHLKIMEAPAITIPEADLAFLHNTLHDVLKDRLSAAFPSGVSLGKDLETVKIPMNGQELSPHGRGTRFPIPEGVNFIRSLSYWSGSKNKNVWFDNSWNFFDANWEPAGATCWDQVRLGEKDATAAIFSGDPVTSKTNGIGAQAIDIYLDQLTERGIRYAVWSTLCFSNLSFNEATEVFACLQWGEDAQKGEIFEPGRAQMAFPIRSDEMNNFTAMIDLQSRELVYLDVSLPVHVETAQLNRKRLSVILPALLETIEAQPSLADIFAHAPSGTLPVLRDDADKPVEGPALVAHQLNSESNIDPVDLDKILSATR